MLRLIQSPGIVKVTEQATIAVTTRVQQDLRELVRRLANGKRIVRTCPKSTPCFELWSFRFSLFTNELRTASGENTALILDRFLGHDRGNGKRPARKKGIAVLFRSRN